MSLWSRTVKILISNWPRTRKFNHFFKYRRGRTFLTMVTRWSRSTSNFYTLIGQKLTGEFMRKIYAASWKLFTMRAEADRVLCQPVMNLTVFYTGCTKWNTAAIKSLVLFMAGLFIGFLVEKCLACQNSVIRFRIASSFSFSTLFNALEGLKVSSNCGLPWYLSGTESRMVSLSNYCIWCLFLLYLISWSRAQFMQQVYARL